MVTVERLYELYNIISESKDSSKHEAEFEEILGGVKGDIGARRMTAQFISRYFGTFPNQEDKAINALFDLCEDDEQAIRKQSISSLGVVCKGKAALVPKVADILAQLLQIDDPSEVNCVNSALVALLRVHVKGTLTGLFYQLENNREEVIRERVLRFLIAKVQALTPEIFTKEIQIFIFTEAKKFIPNASDADLALVMSLLSEMSVCRTITGQTQLADLLIQQLDLTKPLTDTETIAHTVAVLNQVKSFYSTHIKSTAAIKYLLTQAIPNLEQIEAAMLLTGKPEDAAVPLMLLQLVAQILKFAETVEEPKAAMEHLYKALMNVLPVPPAAGEAGWEDGGANLQFSRVECLLYTLQQLTTHCKDFFGDAEALKDFRQRLTYFSRGAQAYQKVLRDAIKDKKGDELKTEESKTKLIALKTTANINTIVKDFFHNPPAAKSTIQLSWLLDSDKTAKDSGAGFKRHAEITVDEDMKSPKQAKGAQKIYAPPGGKFSKGSSFRGSSRGGRGRGRGYYRKY